MNAASPSATVVALGATLMTRDRLGAIPVPEASTVMRRERQSARAVTPAHSPMKQDGRMKQLANFALLADIWTIQDGRSVRVAGAALLLLTLDPGNKVIALKSRERVSGDNTRWVKCACRVAQEHTLPTQTPQVATA